MDKYISTQFILEMSRSELILAVKELHKQRYINEKKCNEILEKGGGHTENLKHKHKTYIHV